MNTCQCSTEEIKVKGFRTENGKVWCLNCNLTYLQGEYESTESNSDLALSKVQEIQKLQKSIKSHRIGALLLWVLIAINTIGGFVWSQVYKSPSYNTGDSSISSAMSNYNLNNLSSTTVYQQQVVNGWVAKDLLETIAKQNVTEIEMQSEKSSISVFLLFNILITLGLIGVLILRIGFMINDQIRLNFLENMPS